MKRLHSSIIFQITGKRGVFQCESCKKERCTGCLLEPHENLTCEEYAKLRSDADASLMVYISKNDGKVKTCPNEGCGAIIEKGEVINSQKFTDICEKITEQLAQSGLFNLKCIQECEWKNLDGKFGCVRGRGVWREQMI
ncbi:unnamed protein product [Cylicostephanus goldi]|uniref:IBR domain-containing protein n=1 Tax=Cylicostephanus goldi TaxID=71465 RepID=A0A3P6RP41_CYLGO|nr:unnamed protein product [Cylicostephanus goldi]